MDENIEKKSTKKTLIIVDVNDEALRKKVDRDLRVNTIYSLNEKNSLFRKLSKILFGKKQETDYIIERIIVKDETKPVTYSNILTKLNSTEHKTWEKVYNGCNINPGNIKLRHPSNIPNKNGKIDEIYGTYERISNNMFLSDDLIESCHDYVDFNITITGKISTQIVENKTVKGWVLECESKGEPEYVEEYHRELVSSLCKFLKSNELILDIAYKCGQLVTETKIIDTDECSIL